MCVTCDKISRIKLCSPKTVDRALGLIEAAIEEGSNYEHFKPLIDELLGTQISPSDPEIDKMWSDTYYD